MPSSVISEAPDTHSACVSHGATLTFETLSPAPARPRRRAGEDTLLRVIDGTVSLTLSGGDQRLDVGDEAIIPAGMDHRLQGVGGSARVVIGFRPASR